MGHFMKEQCGVIFFGVRDGIGAVRPTILVADGKLERGVILSELFNERVAVWHSGSIHKSLLLQGARLG